MNRTKCWKKLDLRQLAGTKGHCFQFTHYLCYVKQQMVNCVSLVLLQIHFQFIRIWLSFSTLPFEERLKGESVWTPHVVLSVDATSTQCELRCVWDVLIFDACFLDHQTCPLLLHAFMTLFLSYMCRKKRTSLLNQR